MLLKLKMENVELSRDLRVCATCRIRISKIPDTSENKSDVCEPSVAGPSDYDIPVGEVNESSSEIDKSASDLSIDASEIKESVVISNLNASLVSIGETPVKKRTLSKKNIHPRNYKK